MKVFNLQKTQRLKIAQNEVSSQNTTAIQEVIQAITTINASIANINQALETLEQTGATELFKRENLIQAIQSGNTAVLNINTINTALNAMSQISKTVLIINNSLETLKNNYDATKMINMDVNTITSTMIKAIQTGSYQEFTNMMGSYQANLKGMSDTQQPNV